MLPEDLVTYAEACKLPPFDPDAPITRDRLRKAVEDEVFPGAVQDECGRRSWRIPALRSFRAAIVRLRRGGDWTHQWTTLRNLVFLLARIGAHQPAAVLTGALDGATTVPRRPHGSTATTRTAGAPSPRNCGHHWTATSSTPRTAEVGR